MQEKEQPCTVQNIRSAIAVYHDMEVMAWNVLARKDHIKIIAFDISFTLNSKTHVDKMA